MKLFPHKKVENQSRSVVRPCRGVGQHYILAKPGKVNYNLGVEKTEG